MADNTLNVRIKDRIDTESNWNSKNPVLLKGERGLIEGTAKYKIGDGSTKWSDLPLYQGMTSTDRSKLDGIATGANKTVVDSSMSTTSTNPVQNKVVKSALDSQSTELKKIINTKLPADFDTVNQNVSFNGSVHAEDLTAGNIIVTGAARFNSGMYGDVHGNATSADSVDWSGVKNKPSTYTPSSHNHDDRYYTEAETDKKLDAKSNTDHTHNSVKDANDGGATTFAYSKAGMNYGDYTWLAAWNNKELRAINKNQFATSGHTHDDRYYTESEINTKLNEKSNTNHTHDLSTMINTLTEGTATPQDNDYYVSQYAGGGTTTTTYHRRPLKALFEYIKGKLSTVAVSGSYNDLSNKPTIPSVGNGTVTIKQAGTSKGTFTMNQSGNTTIELTDNNTNTWRGIQDNLTSSSATDSLSAKQGKWLNENKAGFKEWTASIKCATWSRLCYVACRTGVVGSSFILNVSGTRNSVVYNDTFGIKIHHSQAAVISKLSGSKYGSSIQLRVVSDSTGNGYIEIYDNVGGATNSTAQSVYCHFINIAAGTLTPYTAFTDGSTLPTNFVQSATIKTNTNSLQGNLTWDEVTGKPSFKTVATSGSYNDLSNKPTIGNAKITVSQGGTQKGTFTLNQTGDVSISLTDTNTWRGVQNNLTSTATDQSLSAAQGKWLNENKVLMKTLGGSEDLNNITTVGVYNQGGGNSIKNKPSGVDAFGLIVVHDASGSYYTQLLFDSTGKNYRRFCNSGTWGSWSEDKLTDTVYTHPSYTAKSNGLYKVTVDSKGHVSATTAVAKSDITALGIPSTNTTYSTGTASTSGLTKLYTGTGTATDGTMTQAAIKSALDGKSGTGHTHDDRYYTESEVDTKLGGKANSSHKQAYTSSECTEYSSDDNTMGVTPAAVKKAVGLFNPKAHTHNYAGSSSAGGAANASLSLNNIFGGTRQTSGNIDFTSGIYANKVTYTVATSSMTTGKAPIDGHLLSFGWDTTAGWGAQLHIGDGSGTHMYIRGADSKDSKSVYGDWKTILDSTNYNTYAPSKTGSGASGSWGISVTGSAAKLSSSAGSATQPVYFSDGKPVACTYTINASVPSGAKFTDTNTWRGIQNNLTSTSTTDSLSAAQGKILNERTYQMRDTVIGNTTDFNTMTSAGCYKVQMTAWGTAATYHSPNSYYASLYSYGLLTVDRAFNDGENRIIQVYYPHQSGNNASGTILTRMYNGSSWNAWDSITKGALDWSRILNKPSTFTPSSHNHDDRYYTESEMNSKLDAKSNTDHTHNSVKDVNDGGATTFAYSKAGMNYADYTWLAAWNGKELRAVNKNQFATAGHNHDSVYLKLSGGTVTGVTSFTNTTASTSKSTGAVKVSGGVGVAGRMSANEVGIGDGAVIKYNSTNKCIDFTFV